MLELAETVCLNWPFCSEHRYPGRLLPRYEEVFKPGLRKYKRFSARIDVDPKAGFYRTRRVFYSKRDLVDKELDRLVQEGCSLELVDHSDWAAPIVAVLKPDKKSVHICVTKLNRYPIPKVDDLFTTLQ